MINPLPWLLGQDSDEKELGLIQFVPLVPHYISYLKSEFTTLLPTLPYPYDHKTQQAVDQANEILNKYKDAQHADAQHAKDLRWEDVHTLERIILRLQPLDVIKRRAWSLRGRYHVAVGDEMFKAYERSRPPDPADANVVEAELRDDLELLLAEIHWLHVIYPLGEWARSRITRVVSRQMCLFTIIVFFFVLFDLVAAYRGYHSFVSLFPLILLMGAFGAFISLVQRVQSFPQSGGETILNVLNLRRGRWGFLLAPLSGALFALLAYLLFISGFVKGDLFPSILYDPKELSPNDPTLHIYLSFNSYAYLMMPKSPTDFAKLLIWCFIAGFAERLIPDALNRLIARRLEGYVGMVAVPPSPPDAEAARQKAEKEKADAEAARQKAEKEKADAEAARQKAEKEATGEKAPPGG